MADSAKKEKVLVAAIDFGTTFSGYAYQFKKTYETERTKILANQKWPGDQQLSQKTVTCILFDKEGKFVDFGYPAETQYAKLALKKEHMDWYFFKHFKMNLHDKKITRDLTIEAQNGKKMRAMTVFGASIGYMKSQLLDQLKARGTHVENDRIHWVLTVPAIWSDSAKQFMRESAYEAGIAGGQLTIALEPEAASLYCQVLTEEQVSQNQASEDKNISNIGQKFMVIDLGGGTADITVHRREENGGSTELFPPSGGYFGGTKVDQAFENLIIGLVGAPVYKKFCDNNPYDYLQLTKNFERSKRTFSLSSDEIIVTVPIKIEQYYKDSNGEAIEDAIKQSRHDGKLEWMEDKLIIKAETLRDIFRTCADNLVTHVKDLLRKNEVKGTDIFLLVGGFAESDIMQNAIHDNFPGVKVIIPPDTGLAIVQGAVLYGHNPKSVSSRRAKYTYGINISPPFDPNCHPENHRVSVGNLDRCRDVFKTYIRKGELVETGESKTGKHISLKPNQEEMLLKVFVSESQNPKFVDEKGCEEAGSLIVKLPKKNEKIKVEVQMMFGDTELTVEAQELETNTKHKAFFDFL